MIQRYLHIFSVIRLTVTEVPYAKLWDRPSVKLLAMLATLPSFDGPVLKLWLGLSTSRIRVESEHNERSATSRTLKHHRVLASRLCVRLWRSLVWFVRVSLG